MTFIILIVISLLMILIFRKHRSIFSVIIAILLLFGVTTALLLWGMSIIEDERVIHFFNRTISSGDLYRLTIAWYVIDAVCSALIIRDYIAYRKINSQGKRKILDRGNK